MVLGITVERNSIWWVRVRDTTQLPVCKRYPTTELPRLDVNRAKIETEAAQQLAFPILVISIEHIVTDQSKLGHISIRKK